MKMLNDKKMDASRIKVFVMTLLALICFMNIMSCSDGMTVSEEEINNNQGGENNLPTKIVPTMDWGASQFDVKSKQDNRLSLTTSSETLLRYTDKTQEITIDYTFADNKLTGTSLTQAKISSVDDMVNSWLSGYKQLAKSETVLLYTSKDESALAYGKVLKGSEFDYGSIAWTYIDANEDVDDEPDFSPSGNKNGYDYVDLGIGIGWAVQNVGASSPEKSGGYYMWGETTTRSNCWWWYYSLYNGNVNDYLDEDKFYSPYSDISCTSYDAATSKMGGKWRMPTRAEFYTLINNCYISVGEYKGVNGFIVTGPSGKSIFLPAVGLKKKDEVKYTSTLYLWSSTSYGKANAYHIEYSTKNIENSSITFMGKYYGMPIRGVIDLE